MVSPAHPFTEFRPSFKPLTHTTPFTFTGYAFLEMYEELVQYLTNTLSEEINKNLDLIYEQTQEAVNGLAADIATTKTQWENLFEEFMLNIIEELEGLNDQAMANLILNKLSLTRQALDTLTTYENVLAHGVKGYGISDETPALQTMVDKFPAGTTFYFPPGEYRVDGNVFLREDRLRFTGTHASTIKKTVGSTNYCVFVGLSGLKTGYGAGVNDIEIDNLRFEGDLAQGVSLSAFSANRASGARIHSNVFSQCSQNGHVLDLMGCEDVNVWGNKFGGIKPIVGREYTEAIQIDSSLRSGAGFPVPDGEYFDGTACRNINVHHNEFTDETVGGVTYKAQIPFGSHSWVDGKPHHKLRFEFNRVVNTVDASSSSFPGITHFFGCKDIDVRGNEIIGGPNAFVRFMGGSNAHKPADTDLVSSALVPATYPQQGESVRIRENVVTGVSPASSALIWGYGTVALPVKDMEVVDNTFINCATRAESYIVQFTRTDKLVYSGNKFVDCNGSPLFVQYLDRLDLDRNVSNGGGYFSANITNVVSVSASGNRFIGHSNQLNFVECTDVSLSDNRVVVTEPLAAIRLTTSPGRSRFVKIVGNEVCYTGSPAHDASPGVYVDTDYMSGVMVGNVSSNYTLAAYAPSGVESVGNVTTS